MTLKQQIRTKQNIGGYILIAAGVLVLLTSLAFFLRPPATGNIHPPRIGSKLSDFELPDVNGNLIRLSDYSGKYVLVNTWATWCPPCRAEMPSLNAFYQKHFDDNFIILAINAGESPQLARAFVEEYQLSFPVLVDPQYQVLDGFEINTYPTSILIDPNGIVRNIHVGLFTPEMLIEEIEPYILQ